MEYLQYYKEVSEEALRDGFKPYYKWNTFNTIQLNLKKKQCMLFRFKPYYKWNTFNTVEEQWPKYTVIGF